MSAFYIFLILGTSLGIWGSQTRGTNSENVFITGSLIWIGALIFIFFSFGIDDGFIAIFVSYVVGAICKNVFPKKR